MSAQPEWPKPRRFLLSVKAFNISRTTCRRLSATATAHACPASACNSDANDQKPPINPAAADALRYLTLQVTGANPPAIRRFRQQRGAYASMVMLGHTNIVTEVGTMRRLLQRHVP